MELTGGIRCGFEKATAENVKLKYKVIINNVQKI